MFLLLFSLSFSSCKNYNYGGQFFSSVTTTAFIGNRASYLQVRGSEKERAERMVSKISCRGMEVLKSPPSQIF